jgi:membrane protease YdiL (CAAX protease family)
VDEQRLDTAENGHTDVATTGLIESELFSSQPEPPSLLRFVFFGPKGLRAGWGLLLFVALFYALVQGAFFAASHTHLLPHRQAPVAHGPGAPIRPQPPQTMLVIEALLALSALAATSVMAKIERHPFGSYGLGGGRKAAFFTTGFLWGASFLALLVGALWKAGLLAFDGRLLFGGDVLRYGLVWLAGFLLVAVFEESLMRGYLQITLARGLASLYAMAFRGAPTARAKGVGFWAAAVFISFLFGAGHGTNPGESPIGLLSAGLIGMVFCLTLWRTGSLWWALGFHAAWDWAQSFVFGVADSGTMVAFHLLGTHPVGKVLLSGGATGPEGSELILVVMVLITGVALWTLPAQTAATPAPEPGRLEASR